MKKIVPSIQQEQKPALKNATNHLRCSNNKKEQQRLKGHQS